MGKPPVSYWMILVEHFIHSKGPQITEDPSRDNVSQPSSRQLQLALPSTLKDLNGHDRTKPMIQITKRFVALT